MSHPSFQALVDYLDQQLPADERVSVEQHLATCVECEHALTLAQDFLATAQNAEPTPPQSLVRRAIAAFNRQRSRAQQRLTESAVASFDSWTQVAALGARGVAAEHQLLYSLDTFDLDLQIAPAEPGQPAVVRGQILGDPAQPDGVEGITIRVLHEGEELALRLTDELGRFSISNLPPGSYTLQVVLEERDILIEDVPLIG